ncbi:hypothetical protein EAG_10019 [Camponotus floridanus]|uniref:Uncharacterized protein n=1 Tax=Camponotus floridanus TaxID=104421 RepID=E1ZY66_CAMFO|nr:hypothetical protein EAG_10019 [Camponotus floridanus]
MRWFQIQRCLERIIRFVFCPGNGALLSLIVYSGLIGALIAQTIVHVAHLELNPDDTVTQLYEEKDDQRQPAQQHPANRLRYPIEITSVNDEYDGERHLAVSSHPLGIPVTGSSPPSSF